MQEAGIDEYLFSTTGLNSYEQRFPNIVNQIKDSGVEKSFRVKDIRNCVSTKQAMLTVQPDVSLFYLHMVKQINKNIYQSPLV